MDLYQDWDKIKRHFAKSFGTSLHVSIAFVEKDTAPNVTPIGSLFLNDDQSGFFFEKFTSNLPSESDKGKKICVLGVNSNKWFWVKALYREKFSDSPAIKLFGQLGARKKATDRQIRALKRRMRFTRMMKGHHYLWGDMHFVREIYFTKADKIKLGKMTADL